MAWNIWSGEQTCGPQNHTLRINEACLQVVSNSDSPQQFYIRNLKCVQCDFVFKPPTILPKSSETFIIDTNYGFESYFSNGTYNHCERVNYFQDFGYYSMNISKDNCSDVKIIKEPEDLKTNLGILVGILVCGLAVFWLTRFIYRRSKLYLSSSRVPLRELEMDLGSATSREERNNQRRRQSRITSIDAFRGLCIVLMIFVNYGGGDYSIFKHTPWDGLTIADLVFPWFVWIMGASIVLSFRANLRTSTPRKKILYHIFRRSILLIAFGLILNSEKRYENNLRFTGVLQRLGITYFVVASVEVLTAQAQMIDEVGPRYCKEICSSWIQWVLAIGAVTVHELVTFLMPVPGCPQGYLGPGGLSDGAKYRNCTGGAAGYIDRVVITENHMYHHGTFVKIFKPNVLYDPEGLLGTLTSIFCAFLGVHAARIILCHLEPKSRLRRWVIWGAICVSLGMMLSNGGPIPINKNLWSLSYVLVASSIAFGILCFFYWLIDFTHIWSGAPLIYPVSVLIIAHSCLLGMNAIALYLGHSLMKKNLPWRWVPYTNTHMEILVMDVTATIIWTIVSYIMYRYNVFITL